jgi:hypothetical protein
LVEVQDQARLLIAPHLQAARAVELTRTLAIRHLDHAKQAREISEGKELVVPEKAMQVVEVVEQAQPDQPQPPAKAVQVESE